MGHILFLIVLSGISFSFGSIAIRAHQTLT
jgi:hypothetical protein